MTIRKEGVEPAELRRWLHCSRSQEGGFATLLTTPQNWRSVNLPEVIASLSMIFSRRSTAHTFLLLDQKSSRLTLELEYFQEAS